MKQLLLTLSAAMIMAPAMAQKGTFVYDGSLGGLASGSQNNYSVFVRSGLGYNLTNHFAVGVNGGFSTYHHSYLGQSMSSNDYAVGIFGRYLLDLGPRFFVYAQANVSYLNSEIVNPGGHSGGLLSIQPGAGFKIGRGWALTLSNNIFNYYTNGNNLQLNGSQGFQFGVMKRFGK